MTVKLELSCGVTREVFDLHKVDWDTTIYNGVCRSYKNQTLFALIIDSYQALIKNELEHQQHMTKLWRWVALHPYCNVRTVEE